MKFIHYGSKEFDKDRFTEIHNIPMCNKPSGGLWASPVGVEFGWKEWCEDNDFR